MLIFRWIFSTDMYFLRLGVSTPHVGLLFVFGLMFGPYGALGSALANVIIDVSNGYTPFETILAAIFSFGVSYLAYKLWYSSFRTNKLTKPALNNIYHLSLFLSIIMVCGFIYAVVRGNIIELADHFDIGMLMTFIYFMNFINVAFISGILFIWLSKKIDFVYTPKTSKRSVNRRMYRILFYLLVISTIIMVISLIFSLDDNVLAVELAFVGIFLFGYLTKPFEYKIEPVDENTILERIMIFFLATTLVIATFGMIISILGFNFVENINNIPLVVYIMPAIIIMDIVIVLFFIPGFIIINYVEKKVIYPISSFSQIEKFIKQDEKIEAEGLLNIYSQYVSEKNEIGTLARSYTDLINHNNHYIANIRKIEGEKERINAELDIATRIQASALPTESLVTDDFIIDGYSHPAKEVGGDFFDYYLLDEDNLAIVIGDVSGKGVPAALLAMVTQVIIKQMANHENDPSKILYLLNNHLCENNAESMFITLWLGIYNKTTKKLTFSNAGHNPPLISENAIFRYLDIESGIVLGIMEDFEYSNEIITLSEEIIVYTDGITDANNGENEMYGEDGLLNFFNGFDHEKDPISYLLEDIGKFTKDAEQFDDMTLIYLKIK